MKRRYQKGFGCRKASTYPNPVSSNAETHTTMLAVLGGGTLDSPPKFRSRFPVQSIPLFDRIDHVCEQIPADNVHQTSIGAVDLYTVQ